MSFEVGDAAEVPLPEAGFDAVTAQFSAMLFPDREATLSRLGRSLRPGGRIALATWGPPAANPMFP